MSHETPLPINSPVISRSFLSSIDSHENNFNLIRFFLASSVMFYHSFALNSAYKDSVDPVSLFLIRTSGIDLGRFAVNIFFVISGIFVTQSWLKDANLIRFAARRVIRLIPALFVCTIILGVLAVTFFSKDGPSFLISEKPWIFFIKTSFLLEVIPWNISAEYNAIIPGVFSGLDVTIFNGSLWTLIWEARFYILLGLAGSLLIQNKRTSLIAISALCLTLIYFMPDLIKLIAWEFDLFSCFLGGVIISCAAALIRPPLFWPLLCLSGFLIYNLSSLAGVLIISSAIFLWIGGLNVILFSRFRLNDYSYGVYIYHWPVIQMLRSSIGVVSSIDLFILTGLFVLPAAVLSWHFIERPSTQAMKFFLARKSRDISRGSLF